MNRKTGWLNWMMSFSRNKEFFTCDGGEVSANSMNY